MVFSPDGKHLVLGFSDLVMLWSVTAGEQVRISPKQSRDYCSMALSPGGRELALGTSDGKIELWDMTTRQMIKILCDLSSDIRVSAIAYSPDGKVLASASDSTIRLWDAVIEQRASSNVSPLRNWEMQLGLREKTAKLWRGIAIRKNPAKRLNEQYWSASEVVLSPNGEQVAVKEVPNRYTITVWDMREGQPVQEVKVLDVNSHPGEPGGEISGLAFSFDCKQLASAIGTRRRGSRQIELWDITTGQKIKHICDSRLNATVITFSPNGERLALATHTGTRTFKFWTWRQARS
ncbi:hypothetical protein EYR41_004189 [Orbilia oligospora]|uniref:Anaphase-promoting complex subunit 4 WD40 domain-containing protein n=1 Tax=Orbilia oligospora TaxID=2813651 RepID=A0A8H2E890_ORBOL|nr:hypothetical protein EYR41_004189 [Orbilia oligospora]